MQTDLSVEHRDAASLATSCARLSSEISKVVIGHEEVAEYLLIAASVGGHVLLEGVPGTAKTLIVNAMARAMAVDFRRVQFTPDMDPLDLAGRIEEGMLGRAFQPGPLFTNLLLADEINRTPPRTQAALLEAMAEQQVTVAGQTRALPSPFMVIATQDPEGSEGTYILPDAQLDRFLISLSIEYTSESNEIAMLQTAHRGLAPAALHDVMPVISREDLAIGSRLVDETVVTDELAAFVARLVRRSRSAPQLARGASPRAAVHLLMAARAAARVAGRDAVTVSDVVRMAHPVLRHRLIVKNEVLSGGRSREQVVRSVIDSLCF